MSGYQRGPPLELHECFPQSGVSLVRRGVEAVVCRHLSGCLPNRLHRIELWRVRRQAKQLDTVFVLGKPFLTFRRKVVPRGVVDNQENLLGFVLRDQAFKKGPERFTIKYISEPEGELGIV